MENKRKDATRKLTLGDVSGWNAFRRESNHVQVALTDEDFSGLDMSAIDLANVTFENVGFRGATCRRADFRWSSFTDCDFSRADLSEADFKSTGLAKARKTTFQNVFFESGRLYGTEFQLSDLSRCSFARADLDTTFFTAVICQDVNFSGATLKNVQFKSKELEQARMFLELSAQQADRAIAQQSRIESDFTGADFSDATIHSCEFKGMFDGATFACARVCESSFTGTSLQNCDVVDAEFKWCHFKKAELRGTSFDRAAVVECEFFKCFI